MVDQGIKKDLATRVGGQWSDHERAAGAYNARPHETAHGDAQNVEKQPATEFRVLQDNADKFQRKKDLGACSWTTSWHLQGQGGKQFDHTQAELTNPDGLFFGKKMF